MDVSYIITASWSLACATRAMYARSQWISVSGCQRVGGGYAATESTARGHLRAKLREEREHPRVARGPGLDVDVNAREARVRVEEPPHLRREAPPKPGVIGEDLPLEHPAHPRHHPHAVHPIEEALHLRVVGVRGPAVPVHRAQVREHVRHPVGPQPRRQRRHRLPRAEDAAGSRRLRANHASSPSHPCCSQSALRPRS